MAVAGSPCAGSPIVASANLTEYCQRSRPWSSLPTTASPETVVAPFARGLGADLLIASQLAFDERDRVGTGLYGRNCRGQEKVYQLKSVFGDDVRLAAAYGDTDGDTEMLDLAEQKFMRLFVAEPGKRK